MSKIRIQERKLHASSDILHTSEALTDKFKITHHYLVTQRHHRHMHRVMQRMMTWVAGSLLIEWARIYCGLSLIICNIWSTFTVSNATSVRGNVLYPLEFQAPLNLSSWWTRSVTCHCPTCVPHPRSANHVTILNVYFLMFPGPKGIRYE